MTVARRILPRAVSPRVLARSATALAIVVSASACRVDDPVAPNALPSPQRASRASARPFRASISSSCGTRSRTSTAPRPRVLRGANATMGLAYGRALKGFLRRCPRTRRTPSVRTRGRFRRTRPIVVPTKRSQRPGRLTGSTSAHSRSPRRTRGPTPAPESTSTSSIQAFSQLTISSRDVRECYKAPSGDGCDSGDCHGHGTFVAGSSGVGLRRSKGVNHSSVGLDRNGNGTTMVSWRVCELARRQPPASRGREHVLRTAAYSAALNQAVQAVINAGVAVTVSAGNISQQPTGGPTRVSIRRRASPLQSRWAARWRPTPWPRGRSAERALTCSRPDTPSTRRGLFR